MAVVPFFAIDGVIAVDPSGFMDAAQRLRDTERTITNAALTLSSSLNRGGGMSGTDPGGTKWAAAYDLCVRDVLDVIQNYVAGLAHFAELMTTTGLNHGESDASSVVPDACAPKASDYPFSPSYIGAGGQVLSLPSPPSAKGGSGGDPPGWHFIADKVGYVWPNGHQDELRTVGAAWASMASCFRELPVTAITVYLAGQQSPEVPLIEGYVADFGRHGEELAHACDQLSSACNGYAEHVDAAHSAAISLLEELAETVAATVVIGAALTVFTAGISDAAAGGVVFARAAVVATEVGGILSELIVTAGMYAQAMIDAADAALRVTRTVQVFLELKVTLAASKVIAPIPAVLGKLTKTGIDSGVELAPVRFPAADLPAWAKAGAAKPNTPPGLADWYTEYGGMSEQEFASRYYDPAKNDGKGGWDYPETNYFVPGTKVDNAILPPGTRLDRFGEPNGGWLSPEGTPFAERSLPPHSLGDSYNTYTVTGKPLPPGYRIEQSETASWFGQSGGGIQYKIIAPDGAKASVEVLKKAGYLK